MKWLEDLLLQQASTRMTQDPSLSALAGGATVGAQSPAPGTSRAAPGTEPREKVLVTPPVQAPPTGMILATMVSGAEQDRLMDHLSEF